MRVKRYIVKSVPEALPLIRSELGSDAVILNTKEVRVGGFMGLFSKKQVEVVAAVEEAAPSSRKAPAIQVAKQVPATGARKLARTVPLESSAAIATLPEPNRNETGQQQLMEEIRQMKALVVTLAKQQHAADRPPSLQRLLERLSAQDVEQQWVERIAEELTQHPDYTPELSFNALRKLASALLLGKIHSLEDPGLPSACRIAHFVGPTGVGKTTTIAKLAAELTLQHKQKVGLITADTYRIAAVDQLRTYANILNVPLEVVFSPGELNRAFKALDACELVLMDTAGRNFRNELFVSEVNSMLQTGETAATFLVLAMTAKPADMQAVAERFVQYGVRSVIFTKLDETASIGAVLNLMLAFELRPAYFTFGQTVPDDIKRFEAEPFVEQLLGASDDE